MNFSTLCTILVACYCIMLWLLYHQLRTIVFKTPPCQHCAGTFYKSLIIIQCRHKVKRTVAVLTLFGQYLHDLNDDYDHLTDLVVVLLLPLLLLFDLLSLPHAFRPLQQKIQSNHVTINNKKGNETCSQLSVQSGNKYMIKCPSYKLTTVGYTTTAH